MTDILVAKNVSKSYILNKKKIDILNHINLHIKQGEFVAIMGASGSGKSTLLFSLSGIDTIENGSVKIDNIELTHLKEDKLAVIRQEKIGFIFQQPTLLKNLTLIDNIILPSINQNKSKKNQLLEKARALMQQMSIKELQDRFITQVSGGQLQRAGICRALMNAPKILFADEPTGALNSKSAEEIMNIFIEINQRNTSILLVTHDVQVASNAHRIIFIKDGTIIHETCFKKELYKKINMKEKQKIIIHQMEKWNI